MSRHESTWVDFSTFQYFSVFFGHHFSVDFSRLQSTSPFHFSRLQVTKKKFHKDHLISAYVSKLHLSFSVDFSRHQSTSVHFSRLQYISPFQVPIFTTFSVPNTYFSPDFPPFQYISAFKFSRHQSTSVDISRHQSTSVDKNQSTSVDISRHQSISVDFTFRFQWKTHKKQQIHTKIAFQSTSVHFSWFQVSV